MQEKFNVKIAMPNRIFFDMKNWLNDGELSSPSHQEFVYSFYWTVAYLWRYAIYTDKAYTVGDIKQLLGYNPTEKRINYIIKQDGLLDNKDYTYTTSDFPINWTLKDDELTISMMSEMSEYKQYLNKFKALKPFVKAPKLSIGENDNGLFYQPVDCHMISYEVVDKCFKHDKLCCSGLYLYGLLVYLRDKNMAKNDTDIFFCSRDTLLNLTSWSINKLKEKLRILEEIGLIEKNQEKKSKGNVNVYRVLE